MVRFTFKYLKPVALFLAVAVLFQCCTIYYSQPVSIDQAIGPDKKRVKIITYDYKEWFFSSIYYKNEKLHGILLNPVKDLDKIEVQIDENNIKDIYLIDIKKSRRKTALIVVGIPVGTFLIITTIAMIDFAINGF